MVQNALDAGRRDIKGKVRIEQRNGRDGVGTGLSIGRATESDGREQLKQAERGLRPAKVKQKVSGCFRTEQGARVYARLHGVISTCRKQDRNVFSVLRTLFAHQPVTLLAG
jgi:hypothetical protein